MSLESELKAFNKEVNDFVHTLVPQKVVQFIAKISFELLTRIVEKTPVKTGRAQGGWQMTVDEVNSEEWLGSDPLNSAMGTLSSIGPTSVVYLNNNVPYIMFLEAGSSSQAAPGEMIQQSVNEVRQVFP